MIVLIDNGHGVNTPGKRSPDGRLLEWKFCRLVANDVCKELVNQGYQATCIVKEDSDVSLKNRCERVNAVCKKVGAKNVLLVSIHVNAAGNGATWKNAGGWSAYTSVGKTKSDILAECLYDAAQIRLTGYVQIMEDGKKKGVYSEKQRPFRTDTTDGDRDLESNFYILKNTSCPAVLTENLFQDNKEDVDYLLSEEGRKAIVDLHVDGIINYIKKISV